MNRRAKALLWFYMLVVFPLVCAVLLLSGCATITDKARVKYIQDGGLTVNVLQQQLAQMEPKEVCK